MFGVIVNLSNDWFSPNERIMMTSLSNVSGVLGGIFGFV